MNSSPRLWGTNGSHALQLPGATTMYWAYAVAVGMSGIILIGWAPPWFGSGLVEPRLGAAFVRLLGAVLVAAACFGATLASIDDPPSRDRARWWFVGANAAVLIVVEVHSGIFASEADTWAAMLLVTTILLLVIAGASETSAVGPTTSLTTLFGGPPRPSAVLRLQSAYERQIRQAASQEERHRLARELHDSIKQQIFVVQTAAATAQARFEQDPPGALEAIERVRVSAREAMTEMEVMLEQLRATPLENVGLAEALKKQCEAFGFRTGARVDCTIGKLPPAETFAPGAHQAVFRVAQEALANVARHARASHVSLSLGYHDGRLVLGIQDDGAGFDGLGNREGMGLANMRARAEEQDGRLDVASRPGGGTTITLSLPSGVVARDDLYEYRRLAVIWGIMLCCQLPWLAWTFWRNTGEMILVALPVALSSAVMFARSLVGYVRMRARSEAVL
jgi:signal transduction histidine kinase